MTLARKVSSLTPRQKVLVGLGTLAAIWLVIWLLGFRAPRSPEQTSRDALAAYLRKDPGAVYDLISDVELGALDISKPEYETFFRDYIEVKLAGFRPVGEPRVQSIGEFGTEVQVSQTLTHSDGRRIAVGFSSRPNGREDAKLRNGVGTLMLACLVADFPPGPMPTGSGAVLLHWAKTLDRDKQLLDSTGVHKIWLMNDKEGEVPMTWDDWASDLRKRVQKLHQSFKDAGLPVPK